MAFKVYGATKSSAFENKSDVDWSALNKYVVETAGLQDRETLIGYVSAIVDLGIQKQEDAEYVFEGDAEDEAAEIEKDSSVYFKDGLDPEKKTPCRLKCKPQKDQQSVAIAIDFPDIMLNKGQFFGDESAEEKPLRLWMGNQFFLKNQGMVVGRPTALKVTNLDKTRKTKKWSFAQNHIFYKMAVAAKLIKAGECFMPTSIDKLLGQSFQFAAQVYLKKGSDGKEYYTEYVNFVGALSRGQSPHTPPTEPFTIGFDDDNSVEKLKEIRSHVLNTMKMAKNWEGSAIQKQLEAIQNSSGGDESAEGIPEPTPEKKAPKTPKKAVVEDEDLEDDLPF